LLLQARMDYFAPNRVFLGALMAHAANPQSPLSPFSAESKAIRQMDYAQFERALAETKTSVPEDLAGCITRLLWAYELGILLFWIYDHSPAQKRTQSLLAVSSRMVGVLMKVVRLPLMKPARRTVVELVNIIEG
jgi:hypothetical protein